MKIPQKVSSAISGLREGSPLVMTSVATIGSLTPTIDYNLYAEAFAGGLTGVALELLNNRIGRAIGIVGGLAVALIGTVIPDRSLTLFATALFTATVLTAAGRYLFNNLNR